MLLSKTARTSPLWILTDFSRAASTDAIGFVGLGNMGARMAKNLLNKGEKLIVYDTLPEARKQFLSKSNVTVAKTLEEVATGSSYIISMLPNSDIVKSVYTSDDGIFKSLSRTCPKSDTIFIDTSTIEPSVTQELSQIARKANRLFLDAPVSGGVMGAENGSLVFMVGGCDTVPNNVESLLLKMGTSVVHCGSSGMGQVAKLCNNMLLGATMVAVAESFHAALKCGISAEVLTSIVNKSSGRCWSSEVNNPIPGILKNAPSTRNYQDGFKTSLLIKDLNLGLKMANSKGVELILIKKALQLYENALASNERVRDLDFSIIYQTIAKNT